MLSPKTRTLHRFGRSAHSAEYQREIRPCGGKTRGQLDRPAQEVLRVAESSDPRGQLREHPDRRNVERVLLEVRFQQAFGDVQPVLVHRHRGLDEPRVPPADI